MNFNNCYNKILEQLTDKLSIPTDTYTHQVWLYSNTAWYFKGSYEDFVECWDNHEYEKCITLLSKKEDIDWVLHRWKSDFDEYKADNFEYVCSDIKELCDTISLEEKLNDVKSEIDIIVSQFKQSVTNNPIGYYKLFGSGNSEFFVAYIYLPPSELDLLKDITKDDTDDINDW
jgi:hypothetical protein